MERLCFFTIFLLAAWHPETVSGTGLRTLREDIRASASRVGATVTHRGEGHKDRAQPNRILKKKKKKKKTKEPTPSPNGTPTSAPSSGPTSTPTSTPIATPTSTPTSAPTSTPTGTPTVTPIVVPAVSVYNTFEGAVITGGTEIIFGASTAEAITAVTEFPFFPPFYDGTENGFYDIDVSDTGITMTLKNNTASADLVFPAGRFDRYYFAFDGSVDSATMVSNDALQSVVKILPPGTPISLGDPLGTMIPVPETWENGALVIEIMEGADLTEIGQQIEVEYSLLDVTMYNTFEDPGITGGSEIIFGKTDSLLVREGIEAEQFPKFFDGSGNGFYDVDVSPTTITITLRNNTGAADLILPEDRSDRYYFDFGKPIGEATLVGSDNIVSVVDIVAPGTPISLGDPLGTMIELPESWENGALRVAIVAGTDLTEVGQVIEVNYALAEPTSSPTTAPTPEGTSVFCTPPLVFNEKKEKCQCPGKNEKLKEKKNKCKCKKGFERVKRVCTATMEPTSAPVSAVSCGEARVLDPETEECVCPGPNEKYKEAKDRCVCKKNFVEDDDGVCVAEST